MTELGVTDLGVTARRSLRYLLVLPVLWAGPLLGSCNGGETPDDDGEEVEEREADWKGVPVEIGPAPSCYDDFECYPERPYCHPVLDDCTQCVMDEHCPDGLACDEYGVCREYTPCRDDSDCAAGRCDVDRGRCVACLEHGDCAPEEYCYESFENACRPDECDAGELQCYWQSLYQCSEVGDALELVEVCHDDEQCLDDPPRCEEIPDAPTSTGGPDPGTPPDDDGDPRPPGGDDDGEDDDEGDAGGGGEGTDTADTRGCACAATPLGAPPWLLAMAVMIMARRRRTGLRARGAGVARAAPTPCNGGRPWSIPNM